MSQVADLTIFWVLNSHVNWLGRFQRNAGIAQQVCAQARRSVGAIHLSLSAVKAGFTAVEDIIAFAGLMNEGSPDELREYLVGTLELADKAYTSAQEAYQTFRNIRTTMYEVSGTASFADICTDWKM